ncbi:MAG TPA: YbaB/EbfC family nucleoid-associated protein [Elusimicrobiales bacterium]|nr:YbaB/EbfC family nucleoid-associated protein [Elusimicrobiales bacterium]
MFDKLKDLMKLKSQMAQIKKELDDTIIERTSAADLITISISGSQVVKDVKITGDLKSVSTVQLESILKDVINDAIKSSQKEATRKMGQFSGMGQAEA